MDRKGLVYSGALLIALVIVSVLLSRGIVQAVVSSSDIVINTTSTPTKLGSPRRIVAHLNFPNFQSATVSGVELIIKQTSPDSTTTLDILLPLTFTTSGITTTLADITKLLSVATGTELVIFHKFIGVEPSVGTTLAASTLSGGGIFKGIITTSAAEINQRIDYTTPIDSKFIGSYTAEITVHSVDEDTGLGKFITTTPVAFKIVDTAHSKIVTITSDGEALATDQYFLVVAGALTDSSFAAIDITSVTTTDPLGTSITTLLPISQVSEIVVKMHGLGKVFQKPATHVLLDAVPSAAVQGDAIFSFSVDYATATDEVTESTLPVLGARTNRNVFLFPGSNFPGLAVVPNDTSIANLMTQKAGGANPAFGSLLGRDVTLGDVVKTVWAFDGGVPAWKALNTADPLTGTDPADTLTDLDPFQGMIVTTRENITGTTHAFEFVTVAGFVDKQPVPVKMNIQGSFIDVVTNDPLTPPSKILRTGFNLIAPHISDTTPFDTVFGGSGEDLSEVFGSAVSYKRRVSATSGESSIDAGHRSAVRGGVALDTGLRRAGLALPGPLLLGARS